MGRVDHPTSESFDELAERVSELDDAGLTARFRELELTRRRVEAEMATVVAEADTRRVHRREGHHSIAGWMRAHANHSAATTARIGRLGKMLRELRAVGSSLLGGHIGVDQAGELASAHANPRCGDQLAGHIDVLLRWCEDLSFRDARTCVRRWEMLADLDGAHRDRGNHVEARTAVVAATSDGLYVHATGGATVTAVELDEIFRRAVEAEFAADVAERARLHGLDAPASLLPRTDGQRRFDALVRIFHRSVAAPADGTTPEPLVNIVVDQYTAERALADHDLITPPTDLTAHVSTQRCETTTGIPVLPDDVVRAALTGHVRRVVFDSNGVVTDLGRRQRLFTGAAREAAKLMATSCDWVGCDIRAANCDVDHLTEHHRGGHTNPANSSLGCNPHNRHKHRRLSRGWRAQRPPGNVGIIFYRPDGTPYLPVGRRLPWQRPPATENERIDRLTRQRMSRLIREARLKKAS